MAAATDDNQLYEAINDIFQNKATDYLFIGEYLFKLNHEGVFPFKPDFVQRCEANTALSHSQVHHYGLLWKYRMRIEAIAKRDGLDIELPSMAVQFHQIPSLYTEGRMSDNELLSFWKQQLLREKSLTAIRQQIKQEEEKRRRMDEELSMTVVRSVEYDLKSKLLALKRSNKIREDHIKKTKTTDWPKLYADIDRKIRSVDDLPSLPFTVNNVVLPDSSLPPAEEQPERILITVREGEMPETNTSDEEPTDAEWEETAASAGTDMVTLMPPPTKKRGRPPKSSGTPNKKKRATA